MSHEMQANGREFDAILETPPCLRFHPQSKNMYDFHPNCHSFAGGDCGFCYATKVEAESSAILCSALQGRN